MTPSPAISRADAPRLRLARVVRDRLLSIEFQPIIDLRRSEITGFEALARPAATTGFANPTDLFDAAEASGWSPAIESAAIRQAIAARPTSPAAALLFLNCSPAALASAHFGRMLARRAAEAHIPSARIVIEVTERDDDAAGDLPRATEALRDLGFQIALDDVGAGSSGLSRLVSLRPDWIKLDRQLVQSIDIDPLHRSLIRALTRFGESAGIAVIAEGVETPAQLQSLADCSVRYAQGFLLSRPQARPIDLSPSVRTNLAALTRPSAASLVA